VAPLRGMALVSLDSAMVGVHASELYVLAEVVAAVAAEETFTTGNARLDGYAIACYKLSLRVLGTRRSGHVDWKCMKGLGMETETCLLSDS
jgi:hypothetical protein